MLLILSFKSYWIINGYMYDHFYFSQYQYEVCLKTMCKSDSGLFYDPAACDRHRNETVRLISNRGNLCSPWHYWAKNEVILEWLGFMKWELFSNSEKRSYFDELKNVLCWSVFGPEADDWCPHWVLLKCSWGRKRLQVGTQCVVESQKEWMVNLIIKE